MRRLLFCVFVALAVGCGGSESSSTNSSSSSSSSSSVLAGGMAINGSCVSFSQNGKKSAGSSCSQASDCIDYCCTCSSGSKSYTAYACIDGQCAAQSAACQAKVDICN